MKRWRNFTWLACYRENCGTRVYFNVYSKKKFILQFLLEYINGIITLFCRKKVQLIHNLHSKQEKNWGNMTSCIQLRNNFFLLLFHLIIKYFVRERFELSIGIYVSIKSTLFFKLESLEKMVKTSKFVYVKNMSNNKNNKKRIQMF